MPPPVSMSFLQQPPPSINSSASPQRFVQAMPPPGHSPYPLMSFETINPYQQQQQHGKSPFRSSGDNKSNQHRNHGRVMKQKKRRNGGGRSPSNSQERGRQQEMRASESPSSSISQTTTTAATVASSSVIESVEKANTNTEPTTPNSQ